MADHASPSLLVAAWKGRGWGELVPGSVRSGVGWEREFQGPKPLNSVFGEEASPSEHLLSTRRFSLGVPSTSHNPEDWWHLHVTAEDTEVQREEIPSSGPFN